MAAPMAENSNRVSRSPSKLSECITGVELDQICNESLEMENDNIIYENPVKHLQCDGKINNVTLKTLRIQLWKSVLVNYFGKSKTNVQTQKTGVVIKVIFDTEKEKNNSVKINMYDSVVIQGAKCTVFSDAFFHKLKQECDNKNSENGNHISTEDLHQTAVKVIDNQSPNHSLTMCKSTSAENLVCHSTPHHKTTNENSPQITPHLSKSRSVEDIHCMSAVQSRGNCDFFKTPKTQMTPKQRVLQHSLGQGMC